MSEMPISPMQIDTAQRDIYRVYVDCRRQLFPNYRPDRNRWRNVWTRAAQKCIEAHITPAKLVQTAFDMYLPYPQPNHLLSRKLWEFLSVLRGDPEVERAKHDRMIFQLELDEIAALGRLGFSLREILVDSTPNIGSLYRYALAVQYGFTDLAGQFREAARCEFQFRTRAYHALLPAGTLAGLQ